MPHLLKCWFILLSSVIPDNTAVDPVIEEHFRRSLGKNYKEPEPVSNTVSITGSVDDHFAKALGKTWLQIKSKGPGGHPHSPEANSWNTGRTSLTVEWWTTTISLSVASDKCTDWPPYTIHCQAWLPWAQNNARQDNEFPVLILYYIPKLAFYRPWGVLPALIIWLTLIWEDLIHLFS